MQYAGTGGAEPEYEYEYEYEYDRRRFYRAMSIHTA
jgi:hypothetical protein